MAETYFSDSLSYDAFLEDCKDCNGPTYKAGVDDGGDGAIVTKGDDTPGLTASSSSEDSQPKVEDSQPKVEDSQPKVEDSQPKAIGWAETIISQCNMESACGTLQIERAAPQENGTSASPDQCIKAAYDAATNTWTTASTKASGLADEPWVKEVYDAATNTWSVVSTKASGLLDALDSASKNPNLGEEMSEKAQELKTTVISSAQSFQESVVTPTAKYVQATFEELTSDANAKPGEEIMHTMSISTEPPPTPKEEKTPFNLWTRLQDFIRNFKLPESISKFQLPESSTLFEDLKAHVPSLLSTFCSPMEAKNKGDEAMEEKCKEVVEEAPPTVEAVPTLEAAPTEEPEPQIAKID